jgi:hypothetical protein
MKTIASNAGVEGAVIIGKVEEQADPSTGYDAATGERGGGGGTVGSCTTLPSPAASAGVCFGPRVTRWPTSHRHNSLYDVQDP